MNFPYFPVIIAVVVILILIFVPFIRRLVSLLVRIAIAVVAIVIAIAGTSLLLNNETVFEKPGIEARTIRFFTMKTAATNEKGLGTVTCSWPDEKASPVATASPSASSAPLEEKHQHHRHEAAATNGAPRPSPAASASPSTAAEEPPEFPELMTRSYPGIPPQKLFQLSQQVVNSLGGWKIVSADAHTRVINCTYTTRILGAEDDVRIMVTPQSQVQLCSRSASARPDSNSLLRYFPGDLGANLGHIKQFYDTLEPKMDEVYEEQQEKENANKPPGMR